MINEQHGEQRQTISSYPLGAVERAFLEMFRETDGTMTKKVEHCDMFKHMAGVDCFSGKGSMHVMKLYANLIKFLIRDLTARGLIVDKGGRFSYTEPTEREGQVRRHLL